MDGQFKKAGFKEDIIYSPQGDYGLFQCKKPCSDTVYDNRTMIQTMISNMVKVKFEIRQSDIPHCPICGDSVKNNSG